jgi:hypothetical protein
MLVLTILDYIVLLCIILYYFALYCIIFLLYCIILYYFVLFCITLFYVVLYYIMLYYNIFYYYIVLQCITICINISWCNIYDTIARRRWCYTSLLSFISLSWSYCKVVNQIKIICHSGSLLIRYPVMCLCAVRDLRAKDNELSIASVHRIWGTSCQQSHRLMSSL